MSGLIRGILVLNLGVALANCEGPVSPAGPQGERNSQGEQGPQGGGRGDLGSDGETLEGESLAWKLYWTEWDTESIRRSNLDGSGVENLVITGLDAPGGIALDVAGGKMYWTDWDTDKIQRSNLDGSGVEDLVTGLDSPYAIALDVAGGKMCWTDAIAEKIRRSNLDGSGVEDLVITGLDAPGGLALDVAGGKMYWTDGGDTDRIKRSSLDGSGVEDLVTSGLDEPEGLALDVAGGKMYWADGGWSGDRARGKIQRSNLDGSGVEDLVTTGFWHPVGIALDVAGGKIYWTHSRAKIQRSNLDGSGVEDLFTGLAWPLGIALGFVPVDVEAGTDLAVEASVRDTRLTPGQSFQLSVTVQNRGSEQAAATTLRYYRSDDATIDATDTQLGTAAVDSLATLAPRAYRIDLTAPESTGTYYYGACVESVSGESKIDNNCSSAVTVTVGQASGNYGVGESLPNFPSGSFFPRLLSGASFRSSGGLVVLNFNNGGVIELQDNTTYTCIASDGCSVENGRVTSGTIRVTTGDGDDG